MNASVPAVPKPQITTGAQVAALVPQSLDEAFRVSQAIAASGLAPRGLEKAEQIMVAIMAGAELGFAPFQSLQSFAVVNGRPTLWGDGLVAVVRRNGCSIREWHDGETAYCEVIRPDTGETIQRSFSQADAIKAGLAGKTGPWQQYPQRMRAMRARAWAVRDGCADMLRGFQIAEEVQDFQPIRDVTPPTSGLRARLEANKAAARAPAEAAQDAEVVDLAADLDAAVIHDAETGEVIDEEPFPGDRPSTSDPAPDTAKDEGAATHETEDGNEASGDDFDAMQWAIDANTHAQTFQFEPALKKWWNSDPVQIGFAKVKAANPAVADALLEQIKAHGQSLAGGKI